jgi:hypothetical protein
MITKSSRNVVVLALVLSFPCVASVRESFRNTKDYGTRYTKEYDSRYTKDYGARYTKDYDTRDSKCCFKYPECEHNKTHSVPDGGATLLLLGTALAGIGVAKRFMKV